MYVVAELVLVMSFGRTEAIPKPPTLLMTYPHGKKFNKTLFLIQTASQNCSTMSSDLFNFHFHSTVQEGDNLYSL